MSRLITLPDGRQVTGGKNYVRTPKPGLLIDSRIEVAIALDADGLKAGTPLSIYVRGETSNTQTPLRVWLSSTHMPTAREVTPDQFKAGIRLDADKVGTDPLRGDIQHDRRQLQTVAFRSDAARRDGRIPCDRSFQRILFVSREPAARLGVAA